MSNTTFQTKFNSMKRQEVSQNGKETSKFSLPPNGARSSNHFKKNVDIRSKSRNYLNNGNNRAVRIEGDSKKYISPSKSNPLNRRLIKSARGIPKATTNTNMNNVNKNSLKNSRVMKMSLNREIPSLRSSLLHGSESLKSSHINNYNSMIGTDALRMSMANTKAGVVRLVGENNASLRMSEMHSNVLSKPRSGSDGDTVDKKWNGFAKDEEMVTLNVGNMPGEESPKMPEGRRRGATDDFEIDAEDGREEELLRMVSITDMNSPERKSVKTNLAEFETPRDVSCFLIIRWTSSLGLN
jgi:hypothetical protein